MKIVKPLWIVQPHDSPTAIFSPTNPNAKIEELAADEGQEREQRRCGRRRARPSSR